MWKLRFPSCMIAVKLYRHPTSARALSEGKRLLNTADILLRHAEKVRSRMPSKDELDTQVGMHNYIAFPQRVEPQRVEKSKNSESWPKAAPRIRLRSPSP